MNRTESDKTRKRNPDQIEKLQLPYFLFTIIFEKNSLKKVHENIKGTIAGESGRIFEDWSAEQFQYWIFQVKKQRKKEKTQYEINHIEIGKHTIEERDLFNEENREKRK